MTKSSSVSRAGYALGSRYALSLIDVANQSGELNSIEKDFTTLQSILAQSDDFAAMLDNPAFPKAQLLDAVLAICDSHQCSKLTKNFLGVLADNGRLNALPIILVAFFRELEKQRGIIEAKVVTATALSEAQQKSLEKTLSDKTGKKVKMDMSVDASILGGMIVTVGSRMIDDSLKTRLAQLKQDMIEQKAA